LHLLRLPRPGAEGSAEEERDLNRDIWVTSDTHFGHANIIKFCNRPFDNVHEMDATMVEHWNTVVKPQDLVYHLGDVYFPQNVAIPRLRQLNGTKRLILGNHDRIDSFISCRPRYFQKIYCWREMPEFDLILSHVPVHDDALQHRGGSYAINVHGHIHDRLIDDPRYVNVCVEHTQYTPVHIEELAKRAREVRGK
jgi:calcineurin-like phosphoesterase family protein